MKKSEALNALGLSDGATDEEIKKAHRAKVIENHPDNFALNSAKKAAAEEKTKDINEARDVLLSRKWSPEYGSSPYARPTYNPYGGSPGQQGQGYGENPYGGDPFAGWPFGGQQQSQGQPTYVWTSWDDVRGDSDFNPFGASAAPQKTPEEQFAEAKKGLQQEIGFIGVKALCLLGFGLFSSIATGLFVYVAASVVWGLWKRLGSCLIGLFFPLVLIGGPFIALIAPREGAITSGLALFFAVAVLFDITNMRNLVATYRATKQAVS